MNDNCSWCSARQLRGCRARWASAPLASLLAASALWADGSAGPGYPSPDRYLGTGQDKSNFGSQTCRGRQSTIWEVIGMIFIRRSRSSGDLSSPPRCSWPTGEATESRGTGRTAVTRSVATRSAFAGLLVTGLGAGAAIASAGLTPMAAGATQSASTLYLANYNSNQITSYPLTATGDVAPASTLSSSAAGSLRNPSG